LRQRDAGAAPVVDGAAPVVAGPGAVGMWTKADSVTAFDDFSYGSVKR